MKAKPQISNKKPCNIIMSGGSLKGVAFIGCVRRMEENDELSNIKNLVGCSFGSLILFMLSLGCTSEEMMTNVLNSVELSKRNARLVGALVNCVERGGIDDGGLLIECVKRPLIQKLERSDVTFMEFAKLTGKNLIIVGSNLTLARSEVFSVETTPFMSVVLALRISASIPIVFEPVVYEGHLYVDGALFDNFPVSWLKKRGLRPQDTAGFLIAENQISSRQPNLIFLVEAMLTAILANLNKRDSLLESNLATFVSLKPDGVEAMSIVGYSFENLGFVLSKDDAEKIADYGYSECCRDRESCKDGNDGRETPIRISAHETAVVEDQGAGKDARKPDEENLRHVVNLEVKRESKSDEDVPGGDEVDHGKEKRDKHADVQECETEHSVS
jgi:predicted acylesterase/phospholipase RssA